MRLKHPYLRQLQEVLVVWSLEGSAEISGASKGFLVRSERRVVDRSVGCNLPRRLPTAIAPGVEAVIYFRLAKSRSVSTVDVLTALQPLLKNWSAASY